MTTRVKICGITRLVDAEGAVAAGAQAIGLVFYGQSPRVVDIKVARAIVASLPPFVASVALFVNAPADEIARIVDYVQPTSLQFHGAESPEDCALHGLPYLKAIRMTDDVDLLAAERRYETAQGLLLDTYQRDRPGGTGTVFDWGRVPPTLRKPVILAGGLDADNVQAAIAAVHPYAVDVSGGVESAPGIKDRGRMQGFCRRVQEVS